MHAALVVNRVGPDCHHNLEILLHMAEQAATSGAELIVLPEAAVMDADKRTFA
jgi:predicted amidohydrolase